MCLAQGPQRSDAGEARTRGPYDRPVMTIAVDWDVKQQNKQSLHWLRICCSQHFSQMEKKLEPNEIDCSQDFSQKVESRNCSLFNSLSATSGDFYNILIAFTKKFGPRSGPTKCRA